MQQGSPALNIALILTCCGVLLDAEAEELRFDSADAWRVWQIPEGVVQFDGEGALCLQRFERQVNAVGDAEAYRHQTKEREIARHIDDIFSNFDIFVQLLSEHFEIAIIEKASQCLI